MSYLRFKYPPSKDHRCKTPGWLDRLSHGVELGAIWQCDECYKTWIWTVRHPMWNQGHYWEIYNGTEYDDV